jgi:GTP 3',8-cyclase
MLLDKRNRPFRDLRISVTDKCNLRCRYCMPKEIFDDNFPFLPKSELLTFEEIYEITKASVQIGDVKKLRLTGGEPLLRKDLPKLIAMLSKLEGVEDIAMTTNGILLPKYAESLKKAGLHRVSVSLDSLDDERFQEITGRTMRVKQVLDGIEAAKRAGLKVKVNAVVKKGMNEEDVLPMARHFRHTGVTLRYIEYMDVGNANGWKLDHVLSKKEIIAMINDEFPIESAAPSYKGETADRFRYKDGAGEIGVISSVSDAFCDSCSRARLTADGQLITCLFAVTGTDLKKVVRSEKEKLPEVLAGLWGRRDDAYSEQRLTETKKYHGKKLEMHRVGG